MMKDENHSNKDYMVQFSEGKSNRKTLLLKVVAIDERANWTMKALLSQL